MEQITLKAARINAGLRQVDVMEKLEIARETLIKWERGESYPRLDQMDKMCQLYNVRPSDIFLPELSTFNRTEEKV